MSPRRRQFSEHPREKQEQLTSRSPPPSTLITPEPISQRLQRGEAPADALTPVNEPLTTPPEGANGSTSVGATRVQRGCSVPQRRQLARAAAGSVALTSPKPPCLGGHAQPGKALTRAGLVVQKQWQPTHSQTKHSTKSLPFIT